MNRSQADETFRLNGGTTRCQIQWMNLWGINCWGPMMEPARSWAFILGMQGGQGSVLNEDVTDHICAWGGVENRARLEEGGGGVFIVYCCRNKGPHFCGLKQHNRIVLGSGGQKTKVRLAG